MARQGRNKGESRLMTRRELWRMKGRERRHDQEDSKGSKGKGISELRMNIGYGIFEHGNKGWQMTDMQVRRR